MLEDRAFSISRDYSTTPREPDWAHISYTNKRPPDDGEEAPARKSPKPDRLDSSSLIPAIGRDNSINCLLRCSRADYQSLSSLNTSFRNLIHSGELYRLRRLHGVIEHWIYFSCQLLEWEAFDPTRRRWLRLPRMDPNDCFPYADKESLAVGTDLLVFGRDLTSHAVYRYSLLTNEWSPGTSMLEPRCLFGSASFGSSAIVAGGCDSSGNVLQSAEIYDSETGFWRRLPDMNRARKMCSGVFMDGKFYVVGGVGMGSEILTCAEEFDPATGVWRELPEMSPVRAHDETLPVPVTSEAPPLVAVVGDELYAADYAAMELEWRRAFVPGKHEFMVMALHMEKEISVW
ncbi:galactose oxidase/kelch repeat superfamily protein [Striga asiatica]|uniref:Galactose oxidase/kelch repeat superfamily protein n=1 Tax=Striga asiatica TaxID=4170 RepID=A0A5A7RFH9_STRAF|nr:galactose oxidase/kelch repeat superfamily protein [Striga asiatica]